MPFELTPEVIGWVNDHFRRRGRANLEWTEDIFVAAIESARSKYDVYYSVLALRKVGTFQAVPVLKKLLNYPMSDVKACAILTIAQIARAEETEFYAETLLRPTYREKCYAMWAIEDAADQRAIPAVINYLKKNMRKIQKNISNQISQHKDTALHAAGYLLKFSEGSEHARTMLKDLAAISGELVNSDFR